MGTMSNALLAGTIVGGGAFVDPGISPDPDIPDRAFEAYYVAAQNAPCPLDWRYLAAVGRSETGHGASQGGRIREDGMIVGSDGQPMAAVSSAGALGPMQFMPATWEQYGAGDYRDIDDASAAAARLLCSNNIDENAVEALGAYNGGGNWRGKAESRNYVEATTTYAANLPALPGTMVAPHALSEATRIDDGSLGSKAAKAADVTLAQWYKVGTLTQSTPFLAEVWVNLDKVLGGKGAPAVPTALAPPVKAADGKYLPPQGPQDGFALPCDGPVTSDYGPRTAPRPGATSFHRGVDFGCSAGSPARASAPGRVTDVSYDDGSGNFVVLDHGAGLTSSYSHLSSQSVQVGQMVRQGEEVGKVGSTGVSTGPHLHYAMKHNGEWIDPATMLP
jgi:murein DD-endopeptidase MepM/ murein hydrolase activator NlpD